MATPQKTYLSFGRYLRDMRAESALSLETVSKETRIGIETLLLLENEDHGKLPAEVFVKGFIRAYAKAVEGDGEKAVQLYLLSLDEYKKAALFEADLMKSGSKFWQKLSLSLCALVCIIAASFLLVSYASKEGKIEKEEPEVTTPAEETQKEQTQTPPVPESAKSPLPDIAQKQLLEVLTIENTWMKVMVDDRVPKEYSLKKGERLKLEATSGFNLLIGNAGGVQLKVNGKPVVINGKSGQVVTLQVP